MRAIVIAIVVGVARLANADILLESVGVEVAPTDPQGKPWDRESVAAAPDPRIEISINGRTLKRCSPALDSFVAECEVPEIARSSAPIKLDLHVEDVDLVHNEVIGDAHATIATNTNGRVWLAASGKLVKAWAEVRRVSGIWVSAPIAWLIGGITGVALALLVYARFRRRYLTPRAARDPGSLDPAVEAGRRTRFWRSPVLLAGAACAVVAIVVASYVRGPATQPLFAVIPLALGAFSITGTLIDAFVHEHLGATRARVLAAGAAAIAVVPILHALGDIFTLFTMIIGAVVLVLIVWSVLDSI